MKTPIFLFTYLLSIFILGCNESNVKDEKISNKRNDSIEIKEDTTESNPENIFEIHQDIDTFHLGDLNSDGVEDTAIVFSPFHAYPHPDDFSGGGCEDESCVTTVHFNFTDTILKHKSALGFQTLFAVEDLSSNGFKEIGFIPLWFQSCWQGLFCYSFDGTSWNQIGVVSVYACSDEDFSKRIVKVDPNSFKMISMKWSEDGGELVDEDVIYTY